MASSCSSCDVSILNFVLAFTGKESEQLIFAERHGLIKLRSDCGRCGRVLKIKKRRTTYYFRCDSRVNGQKCAWNRSAVKGTCFEQTRLTLEKVLLFFVYWCKIKRSRQLLMCHELSMNYTTFVDWSRFCRGVCTDWAWKNSRRVGGEGVVVEIYESKCGRGKFKEAAAAVEGLWVFAGVERGDASNFFLRVVDSGDKFNLLAVVEDRILPGTTIVSDCWKTYGCLEDESFRQLRANNSLQFVCAADGGQCPSADYSLQGLGWRKQHFEGYLSEHLFRSSTTLQNIVHKFLVAVGDLYKP